MSCAKKKIKVIYSSTNEKDLKDAVLALIKIHENNSIHKKRIDDKRIVV